MTFIQTGGLLNINYVLRSTIFFYLGLFIQTIFRGQLFFKVEYVSREYGKCWIAVWMNDISQPIINALRKMNSAEQGSKQANIVKSFPSSNAL